MDQAAALSEFAAAGTVCLGTLLKPNHVVAVTQPDLTIRFATPFAAATGWFSASAVLPEPAGGGKTVSRTLTCKGLYISDLERSAGSDVAGFFLLPERPIPRPIQSGKVTVRRQF